MKRILLMVFKNILLVPVMWCKLCYYAGHVEKYTEQQNLQNAHLHRTSCQ